MINWNAEILPNFILRETRCPHCDLVILDKELLVALDSTRRTFDGSIYVTSWTRCRDHNEEVDGATQSYHLNGRAVDIRPVYDPALLDDLELIARQYFPFVLPYAGHLHCDVRGERPNG